MASTNRPLFSTCLTDRLPSHFCFLLLLWLLLETNLACILVCCQGAGQHVLISWRPSEQLWSELSCSLLSVTSTCYMHPHLILPDIKVDILCISSLCTFSNVQNMNIDHLLCLSEGMVAAGWIKKWIDWSVCSEVGTVGLARVLRLNVSKRDWNEVITFFINNYYQPSNRVLLYCSMSWKDKIFLESNFLSLLPFMEGEKKKKAKLKQLV